MVDDFIAKYGTPVRLFIKAKRKVYLTAKSCGIPHKDIEQYCWQGVLRAAKTYDPNKKSKTGKPALFSTYALYRMLNCVSYAIRNTEKATARRKGVKVCSGDQLVGRSAKKTELWNVLKSATVTDPEVFTEDRAILHQENLETALRSLDDRSREILILRFGMGGETPKKLNEIGNLYGITLERVRQILKEATDIVKARFGGDSYDISNPTRI